ncbi:MAG: hypothetical protein QM639_03130 [Rhodocyclaceae bacterium]|jgi:hypothetical protein
MSRINREWHAAHRMPEGATLDQRVAWHAEHTAHCACRPPPAPILQEFVKRGIAAPVPPAQD